MNLTVKLLALSGALFSFNIATQTLATASEVSDKDSAPTPVRKASPISAADLTKRAIAEYYAKGRVTSMSQIQSDILSQRDNDESDQDPSPVQKASPISAGDLTKRAITEYYAKGRVTPMSQIQSDILSQRDNDESDQDPSPVRKASSGSAAKQVQENPVEKKDTPKVAPGKVHYGTDSQPIEYDEPKSRLPQVPTSEREKSNGSKGDTAEFKRKGSLLSPITSPRGSTPASITESVTEKPQD